MAYATKPMSVFLAASSLLLFLVSCQPSPAAQPWDKESATAVHTAPTPPTVPLRFVPVGKVKQGVPTHLKKTLQIQESAININADILIRTREPQSCAIYRVEDFRYDPEEIARLIFGKNADAALTEEKNAARPEERPEFHFYRSGNTSLNIDNSIGWMAAGSDNPRYMAAAEEDKNAANPEDPHAIPSGKCDAISFSREEAIQKAVSHLEPFHLPVDLSLPRVKACQWHGFQYYEITFEQLYAGIPAYTESSSGSMDQSVRTMQCVLVQVCQEGVLSTSASLSQQTGIEAEYDRTIDFDTACGLFQQYISDRLAQFPVAEVDVAQIEFAYFPVLPEKYDGSQRFMIPCWIFRDTNHDIVAINGLDGSWVQS